MSKDYNAGSIEVLSGLDPVKRRPGMYTETDRPNHLAQEVIDNSVDEALAGHAKQIDIILHPDNSLSVSASLPGRAGPCVTFLRTTFLAERSRFWALAITSSAIASPSSTCLLSHSKKASLTAPEIKAAI
jgi:hypothetical protein